MMLKGRGRDVRAVPPSPVGLRSPTRVPLAKPEPDYEVVEFPSEQYVNAKLQAPPPPPPRPPTGHPLDTSCGLCGGGGARVRCTECGRRALCASCDDMYHRHPKRRNHQRQALPPSQLKEERPPLPPKGTPPVPPPRRHKLSGDRSTASPKTPLLDQRRATLSSMQAMPNHVNQVTTFPHNNFAMQRAQIPHLQTPHINNIPNFAGNMNTPASTVQEPVTGNFNSWGRPRASLPGYNVPPQAIMQPQHMEHWDGHDNLSQTWSRPLRRGGSVMELGPPTCSGCGHCAPNPWRYGSCANLDHSWNQAQWPQTCCMPPMHNSRMVSHPHMNSPQTPQPYRRADSRAVSRAASRANSRAPSPALSMRSRVSRRTKHRTPSPSLPSSDADSESEPESDREDKTQAEVKETEENDLGPAPPPPSATWQCEHCTFVNEPGVRVCAVCCRTPTVKPKIVPACISLEKLKVTDNISTPIQSRNDSHQSTDENRKKDRVMKERISTGCGPSPPKDVRNKTKNRLGTPTRENEKCQKDNTAHSRQDIAVGPSPPKEFQNNRNIQPTDKHPARPVQKHCVSVGPSPPRSSPVTKTIVKEYEIQKKSVGSSPPKESPRQSDRPESRSSRTNVSTTGTSPPPQSISTQTYEVPNNWERPSSVTRSRPRRRFREERRERSHSRHSLSSDTRESERSVRTTGGRWEWRDSSPGNDWSESERKRASDRLTRRASHLDLRKSRPTRKTSLYGSEAPSPEPLTNNRALSLEVLAGVNSRREAERGLELARLMTEAERLGFSAAEVHAALAQNPVAPLAWLRERWPSLVAGVRAAATRLAPGVNISELEARAALAKNRGAMWPAVTECVERHRRQNGDLAVSEEGKLRGRVWGSPAGVDDESIPPYFSNRSHRSRAGNSSDEFEESATYLREDDWMYLPLDVNNKNMHEHEDANTINDTNANQGANIAEKLKLLLDLAGIPDFDENLLSKGLGNPKTAAESNKLKAPFNKDKNNILDFVQSEKDFIEAYNALTRLSPLPNIDQKERDANNPDKKSPQYEKDQKVSKISEITTKNEKSPEVDNQKLKKNYQEITPSSNKNLRDVKRNVKQNVRHNEKEYDEDKKSVSGKMETKSNNLNDLVDTTQKIIQQMKNEISYNTSSSQESEGSDSGSSNTDHSVGQESSYSENDDNTQDLSSEENETPSEEQNKGVDLENRHMTSSEDTEQFEEAIDYIDAPSENMHQNILLLDSIANNLQGVNVSVLQDVINTTSEEKSEKSKEDINNNYFPVANSFEEIYEKLNNENNEIQGFQMQSITSKIVPGNVSLYLQKETLEEIDFKISEPVKQVLLEIELPVMNAVLENVNEPERLLNSNLQTVNENYSNVEDNIIQDKIGNKDQVTQQVITNDNNEKNMKNIQEQSNVFSSNKNVNSLLHNSIDSESKLKQNLKSSIPVLVKTAVTNKLKQDKHPPTTVSKLPIRRASLKQYRAPAPPTSQFNNLQNGHIQQIQNQLLNRKQEGVEDLSADKRDVVPSTSANIPENNETQKIANNSPPKVTAKEKDKFFRETCRTEDEWTDSDSGDDFKHERIQPDKDTTPTPQDSTPVPITMRRISGQLIDLTRIQLPEGSPERQARMLLAEGATENWDQARIAVELTAKGTDVATALLAALECNDLSSALAYLNQYCELCAANYPEHEMVSMLQCSHRCCRECARHYFTVQITERSIVDCVCAYCKEPELENLNEDAWVDYFAHLDILLKTLLDKDVHELFQRKLRDRTLARDPNFRWCVECSSGFFVHPKHKKLRCPECKSVTCATCRKPWSSNHDGISCEQYALWLEDNDPERSIAAVQQHLKENGLECPRCRFKYSLSRGGCMHFTCTQCKYEFCYGCGKPFMMGARCGLSDYCAKLGLHAHHPRNCLFYLRDKEPHELQTLLQMNNVAYETEAPPGSNKRCPIQLQRETPTGLIDTTCGSEVLPNNAGLCKMHYVEYLAGLARTLDPIPIMEVSELVAELRRRALPLPERGPWDTDPIYAGMCAEIVKEKIPLD